MRSKISRKLSSSTFLRGDNSWVTPTGFDVSSITGATALTVEPATTDEFVLSDAGTLKRIDYDHIKGVHKNVFFVHTTETVFTHNTTSQMQWDTPELDPDSVFDASNEKWVCPANGTYFFHATFRAVNADGYIMEMINSIFKNGSSIANKVNYWWEVSVNDSPSMRYVNNSVAFSLTLAASDYLEFYMYLSGSGTSTNMRTLSSGTYWGGWRLY